MPDRTRPVPADLPADPVGGPPMPEGPHGPSRRTLLRTAGLVALTGGGAAMAACSSDAEVTAPAASSTAPSPAVSSSTAPSSAASSPSAPASAAPEATPSATNSVAAPKGPGVATAKVPVGGGVILDDADYVITQPAQGEFKAFSKICTHNGCPVTEISGKDIVCKCHGSRFSIEDGSVANPPARTSLAEAEVTVAGGKVVVTG